MTGTFPRPPYPRTHPLPHGALAHKGGRYGSCRKNHRDCGRFGPCVGGRGSRHLFNHLVRAQHYRWGYSKAERLGGPAVHDHLELGRQLHREIARLFAAQDAIHIGGGATPDVYPVDERSYPIDVLAAQRRSIRTLWPSVHRTARDRKP